MNLGALKKTMGNKPVGPLESEKSSERFKKWQGYKKVLFFPSTLNRIGIALQMQLKNFKGKLVINFKQS